MAGFSPPHSMNRPERQSGQDAAAPSPGEALPVEGLPPALQAKLAGIQDRIAARARSAKALAMFVSGKVSVFDPLTRNERLVRAGDSLSAEMVVSAGDGGSRAMLRLDDGSEVWLGENSELDLSRWGGARRTLLLERGRLLAFVAKNAAKRFVVQLRQGAQVEAVGTSFDVLAGDSGARVDILSGLVTLRDKRGEISGSFGDRLLIRPEGPPRKARGSLSGAQAWLREAFELTGAAGSPEWSMRQNPLWSTYRNVSRPAAVARGQAWLARWGRWLLAAAALGALAASSLQGYREGVFLKKESYSREEVMAAAFELQQRQVRKYGPEAAQAQPPYEAGVVRQARGGSMEWVALSDRDLQDIENAGIPDDLKKSLLAGAAKARERGGLPKGDVIELGETRIDYSYDVLATSDFVKWLASEGFSRAEARRRAALGLAQSIRERLPEEYRESASIPVTFDETRPAE
jgi:hypothetical protein